MSGHAADKTRLAPLLSCNAEMITSALRDPEVSPMSALLAARTVAELAEEITRIFVERARLAGHTWAEIGQLLRSSRQAAQQRFGTPAGEPLEEFSGLATRAGELVEQLRARRWAAASTDWTEHMRAELPTRELAKVWDRLQRGTGPLLAVGRASVVRKGPFRIADVPLAFEHGPMRARVTFDHDEQIAGLFFLLPDTVGTA